MMNLSACFAATYTPFLTTKNGLRRELSLLEQTTIARSPATSCRNSHSSLYMKPHRNILSIVCVHDNELRVASQMTTDQQERLIAIMEGGEPIAARFVVQDLTVLLKMANGSIVTVVAK